MTTSAARWFRLRRHSLALPACSTMTSPCSASRWTTWWARLGDTPAVLASCRMVKATFAPASARSTAEVPGASTTLAGSETSTRAHCALYRDICHFLSDICSHRGDTGTGRSQAEMPTVAGRSPRAGRPSGMFRTAVQHTERRAGHRFLVRADPGARRGSPVRRGAARPREWQRAPVHPLPLTRRAVSAPRPGPAAADGRLCGPARANVPAATATSWRGRAAP